MKYKKWRELEIDPFKIPFEKLKIKRITGYLPAGNDVIKVKDNNDVTYIVKIERSKIACFDIENKHLNIIKKNSYYEKTPKILEFGIYQNKDYIVEEFINAKRINELLDTKKIDINNYLFKMGKELGKIHNIPIKDFDNAKLRIINEIPDEKLFTFDNNIMKYIEYLKANDFEKKRNSFIHGDFHYANILWKNNNIYKVIDFEYSGYGLKEQDIAWALVKRPGQKFLNSIDEINIFLEGYTQENYFDIKALKWCLINGYVHFYLMNKDENYRSEVLSLLDYVIKY